MDKRKIGGMALDVLWYLVIFALMQIAFVQASVMLCKHFGWLDNTMAVVVGIVVSSIVTTVLFAWRRYWPANRGYLRSRPWTQLAWVCFLAVGLILPSQWFSEILNVEMPDDQMAFLSEIMRKPYGYLAIGVFAPFVEEIVFRGAIMRRLEQGWHGTYWVPVVISALLFALVHLNMAQGIHAFMIGLLLGWMYHHTGSIVPGFAFHLVNNSVAYVIYNLVPGMEEGKLINFFNGNHTTMMLGLLFSLLIAAPAFLQLMISLRKSRR